MKANFEFNLPEDQEQFNVASKSMDWALLAWDIDQMIRSLLKYHPEEYNTGEKALYHVQEEIHNIMEEKGLQFPA
jgi:myo-inositol catabolism protein IolC